MSKGQVVLSKKKKKKEKGQVEDVKKKLSGMLSGLYHYYLHLVICSQDNLSPSTKFDQSEFL